MSGFWTGVANFFTGGALSAAGDAANAVISTKASNAATGQQLQSISGAQQDIGSGLNSATSDLSTAGQASRSSQAAAAGQTAGFNAPYQTAGQNAAYSLNDMMGNGGLKNPAYSFDPSKDTQAFLDPSMKFTMDQAMQALNRSAAGKGRLYSGGTLKELTNYAEGLATTNWNNAENQAQSHAFNVYNAGRQNVQDQFSRLYGIGTMGQTSNAQEQQAVQNQANEDQASSLSIGGQLANANMSTAGQQANLETDTGNVEAAGTMRNAGIATQAISDITGAASQIPQNYSIAQMSVPGTYSLPGTPQPGQPGYQMPTVSPNYNSGMLSSESNYYNSIGGAIGAASGA